MPRGRAVIVRKRGVLTAPARPHLAFPHTYRYAVIEAYLRREMGDEEVRAALKA